VTAQSSKVSVWLGKGDGNFIAGGSYAAGNGSADIVATDLNGDHTPDIVTADTLSNDVPILIGVTRSTLVQPTSITFPDQFAKTVGPIRTVTVSYSGSAVLRLAMAELTGPNARDFSKVGDTCSGAAIPAGGSCTVSLRFAPKAVGSRVASLQIIDDAATSPRIVTLAGTGLLRLPPTLPAGSPRNRDLSAPPPPPPPHLVPASIPSPLVMAGQPIPSTGAGQGWGGGSASPSPLAVEREGGGSMETLGASIRLIWSDLLSALGILIR